MGFPGARWSDKARDLLHPLALVEGPQCRLKSVRISSEAVGKMVVQASDNLQQCVGQTVAHVDSIGK